MPIDTDTENRIKDSFETLRGNGADLLEVDGGSLRDFLDGIKAEVREIKEENTKLKARVKELENAASTQESSSQEIPPPAYDAVTKEQYDALKQQVEDLEDIVANLKVGSNDIDLNKEFAAKLLSVEKTDLILDEIKPAIEPDILNQALKLNPNSRGEVEDYSYPPGRTIPNQYPALTMPQWLDPKSETSKFMVSGTKVDNSFDFANPQEDERVEKGAAVKSAPTGGGKSTGALRCGAFHALSNEEISLLSSQERAQLGVTLVVPQKSLVGSVLDGHEWLTDTAAALESIEKMKEKISAKERKPNGEFYTEQDIDYRVIRCEFCGKEHTKVDDKPYETVHNGASNMINVFYWAEFLDAYVNNPSIIKKWVYFDEAHLKAPVIYRSLITCLIGGLVDGKEKVLHRYVRKDQFSVLLFSATYPKLPTSIQLRSKHVRDYFVPNFKKMTQLKNPKDNTKERHPNIFKRKLLIFIDKPEKDERGVPIVWKNPQKGEKVFDKINVGLLEQHTKVIIANRALMPYITGIIRNMEPPLIVILSSDYEMGFSFGHVDCISTGYVVITVVVEENGKWVEKEVEVPAELYNLLQQRGRVGRDEEDTEPVWMVITKDAKYYPPNILREDVPSKLLLAEFDKKGGVEAIDKAVIKRIVEFYNQDKPVPEIDPAEAAMHLRNALIKDLKRNLIPRKLFSVTNEEKEKVETKRKKLITKADRTKNPELKKQIMAAANALKVREPGEYIFENELLKYFQADELQKILFEATNEQIRHWRKNEKEEYVFDVSQETEGMLCGFYINCRDETKYKTKIVQNSKGEIVMLSIKFEKYKKIKEGTQIKRTLDEQHEVIYEMEKEEVWRGALFEIPPKEITVY